MGKYDGVLKGLQREIPGGEFQGEVDKVKTRWQGTMDLTPGSLAALYSTLRDEKDVLDAKGRELNIRTAACEQLLWDSYEAAGMTSLKLATGDTVRVQAEPYASVVDAEMLREWAKANGMENKLTLPWMTANALAKQALMDGTPVPAGLDLRARNKTVRSRA
jgi:hypothetical protein